MAYNPQDYYSLIAQAMGGTNPNVAPVNAGDQADGEQVPAYILEALKAQQEAQQGQQAPDTPLGQAMAPQAPATPLGQAMDPSGAPQQPPQMPQQQPGFLDRLNNRGDSKSIYDGLINGGAAMIGAKNLKEGLAANITGFNDAYDAKTDKDKAENTPKVTQLADGAFSSVQYPGKPPVIMKNEQVASFLNGQKEAATQAALAKIDYQAKATAAATKDKEDRKISNDATEALQGTRASLDKIDQALDIVDKQDRGAQVAGAVPGIAGFFGGDTASQNKFLSSLQVDARLAEAAFMKGAISDKEQAMLKEPVPSLTDDRKTVWKPWLEQRKAALQKVDAFQAAQASRGTPAAAPAQAQRPASSPAGAPSNIPALTSKADFDALPSGTLFKAPDGTTRRKP
jgi:hypothetical protein